MRFERNDYFLSRLQAKVGRLWSIGKRKEPFVERLLDREANPTRIFISDRSELFFCMNQTYSPQVHLRFERDGLWTSHF